MQLRHEITYDAPPEEVFAMLADPAFREKVCAAQEVVSCDVRVTPAGDGFSVVVDMVQNTSGLPAIAKKFAGDTTRAVLAETWGDATGASLEITAPGKPTTAKGTITLSATGSGTTELVELDVKVKVPLVGGKLEGLMADTITSGYQVEQTVGAAWLAGAK